MRWFDEYPETVIVVNSMSKTFAMTGWRLGYAVAHPSMITAARQDPEPFDVESELDLAGRGARGARTATTTKCGRCTRRTPSGARGSSRRINAIDGLCCARSGRRVLHLPRRQRVLRQGQASTTRRRSRLSCSTKRAWRSFPASRSAATITSASATRPRWSGCSEGVRRIEAALQKVTLSRGIKPHHPPLRTASQIPRP